MKNSGSICLEANPAQVALRQMSCSSEHEFESFKLYSRPLFARRIYNEMWSLNLKGC